MQFGMGKMGRGYSEKRNKSGFEWVVMLPQKGLDGIKESKKKRNDKFGNQTGKTDNSD